MLCQFNNFKVGLNIGLTFRYLLASVFSLVHLMNLQCCAMFVQTLRIRICVVSQECDEHKAVVPSQLTNYEKEHRNRNAHKGRLGLFPSIRPFLSTHFPAVIRWHYMLRRRHQMHGQDEL